MFYNEEQPRMSLDWDKLETTNEAFGKLRPFSEGGVEDLLAADVAPYE